MADEICSAGIGFGGGDDFFLQPVCPYLERSNYLSAAAFSGAVWKFAGKNSVRFTFGTAFNKSYLPVLYCAIFFVYGSVTCRILHGAVWFYSEFGETMKYLSQEKFDRLQKLIESVIAVYTQARETQENKKCVSGFDREAFLGEKELYSDHIIGCAVSATHYQDRRITDETLTKILKLNHGCDPEKYPHLYRFLNDETLQERFPCANQELQILFEIKTILQGISSSEKKKEFDYENHR